MKPGNQLGTATSVHFSTDRIEYQLSAEADSILVENEPAFKGWHGYIDCNPELKQAPVLELWPLRAWRVPTGSHRFCVRFVTPGLRVAGAISLACLVLWLTWGVWIARRFRRFTPTT